MKLKHTIDDLDLWYQEHMRTRSHGSPRTGRDSANYRQINAVRHDRPLLSSQSAGQLGRPTAVPSLLRISARRTNSTGSSSFVEVEDEGECSSLGGSGGNLVAAAAAVPSVDSGGRASVLGSFLHRLNRPAIGKHGPSVFTTCEFTSKMSIASFCDMSPSQNCAGLTTAPCSSPTFNCPATTETGVQRKVMKIPRTAVPDKETTYTCMTFELDQSQDYHMIATKPEIDNADVIHHITLFGCGNNAPAITSPQRCEAFMPACQEGIGFWTVGMTGQCLHKDAGFRIGKTGYKMVLLQFHWNNPLKRSGQMDGSGLSIYYTPNLRPYDAGLFWTGETNLVIPPGRSRTVVESTCPARCTNKILSDTIYIISGFNHMHYKGIAQTVELLSGDERRYLTNQMNYSYDNPISISYDPPVAIRRGDAVKTTCVYQSVSATKTTFYGFAISNEMCYGTFTYFPKHASSNSVCVTWNTINTCDMEGGTLMGCRIADFFNNSHPDTKMVMDKVLDNCSPYGGCRQECPAAIAEAEKHPCLAKGEMQDYLLTLRSRNPDLKTTKFLAAFGSCSCRTDGNNNNGGFPVHTGGTTSLGALVSTVVLAFSAVLLL